MRWRCAAGIFHRSAVFSRRTSVLLHLTIRSPESDGPSESYLKRAIQPVQPASFQIDPIHAVMEVVLDIVTEASSAMSLWFTGQRAEPSGALRGEPPIGTGL